VAFTLDASVAASWAFPDENDPRAKAAFVRMGSETAHVPALWWFEIRNIVIVNERRGRITEQQTRTFLSKLARLPILEDRTPVEAEVLALARRHYLTVYDAAYLELAIRAGCPLATLDGALIRAAQAEAVRLLVNED
jgi:predicted nucleic acid-binding protein